MKRFPRALKALILLMVVLTSVSFAACKKKDNITPGEKASKPSYIRDPQVKPTDNDEEGWFSIEVLSQYSASAFTIPKDSVVTEKPERDFLYLKGGENLLKETAIMAYKAIAGNDKVALPVYSLDDDGIAKVTSFKYITSYSANELLPDGNEDEVTFVYKSGHKYYECEIGNHTDNSGNKLVYIDFTDKTEEYKNIFNKR